MQKSFQQINKQLGSQLDISLRIIRANGIYAEKVLATHFAMLRDLLQVTKIQKGHADELSYIPLSGHGKILVEYSEKCFRNGIDYQKQMLNEFSLK